MKKVKLISYICPMPPTIPTFNAETEEQQRDGRHEDHRDGHREVAAQADADLVEDESGAHGRCSVLTSWCRSGRVQERDGQRA